MKIKSVSWIAMLLIAVMLTACSGGGSQPAAQEPAAPPPASKEPAAQETQKPEKPDEFAQLIEAAKKEGKIVVYGPPGEITETNLTKAFEERYGIDVLYQGGRTSTQFPKLKEEHAANQMSGDVLVGGANTGIAMYNEKMIQPIPPMIKDPDILENTSKFHKGSIQFVDKDNQYLLSLLKYANAVVVNTDLVKEGEITTAEDLLDPKWTGRIGVSDPRVGGAGNQNGGMFLGKHGEEFTKKLYIDQKPEITRDLRQLSDDLVRGKFAIAIGTDQVSLTDLLAIGVDNWKPLVDIEDLVYITGGNGHAVLLDGAPNPNAAALYINWLLSAEGQALAAQSFLGAPIRQDLPLPEGVPDYVKMRNDINYDVDQSSLEYIDWAEKARGFFEQILK